MKPNDASGFTLIELSIVAVVIGIILAISIPGYLNLTGSHKLQGATAAIASQLRLAREKAIATGVDQPMRFQANNTNSDYRILLDSGQVPAKWRLPSGITYYSVTSATVRMKRDGSAANAAGTPASNTIVLKDQRGNRDTVSVQASGLVLTK